MKNNRLTHEKVVDRVVDVLEGMNVGFTFLGEYENARYEPQAYPESFLIVEDIDEKFTTNLSVKTDKVVLSESLQKVFGDPSELRGSDPVWKFGVKDRGQLWVYTGDQEEVVIDIRYYYEKV